MSFQVQKEIPVGSESIAYTAAVPERDENTEAVRNVEKATESEPVKGEDLLESEELKQKLREAKQQGSQSRPEK